MKRKILAAAAAVLAACLVFVDPGAVRAEVTSRAISPAGSGIIYAIGQVGPDFVITSYVRSGGNWYSGVASISGNIAIPVSNPMASAPTVYTYSDHLYAYISQSVTYNGKPAL